MKTIGIIGGLGPPSTVKYYEGLTAGAVAASGGRHGARIVMVSLDGAEVAAFRKSNDDAAEGAFFAAAARRLEAAGADFVLIASNTSHKNAPFIEDAVSIPLLHLAEATARAVVASGVQQVALLGTALTMESGFYRERLEAAGLKVDVPDAEERRYISSTIYDDLVHGRVPQDARARFSTIAARLADAGAGGVVLGCTELTLLGLEADEVGAALFDTTEIHIAAALQYALEEG